MLFGNVGLLDLRILGLMKELPARPLNQFVRWGVFGFGFSFLTGLIFFVGQPTQYMGSTPFYIKLSLIALAGLNVGAFYTTGMFRRVEALGPETTHRRWRNASRPHRWLYGSGLCTAEEC